MRFEEKLSHASLKRKRIYYILWINIYFLKHILEIKTSQKSFSKPFPTTTKALGKKGLKKTFQ